MKDYKFIGNELKDFGKNIPVTNGGKSKWLFSNVIVQFQELKYKANTN
jgi:hypothetical protein